MRHFDLLHRKTSFGASNKTFTFNKIQTLKCTTEGPFIRCANVIEFSLNVFHWIQQIQWLNIYDIKRTRTCHPATSCVRDQHDTTAPARHMWDTGSLNQAQFMFHWSSVSLNSLNSAKVLLHLGKTPICVKSFKEICIKMTTMGPRLGVGPTVTSWDTRFGSEEPSPRRSFSLSQAN